MSYLAMCAIFRDEGPYLEEWVRFHHLNGVEHFFLYDNGSADDGPRRLQPFVESGLVTLINWPVPFDSGAQDAAFNDCLSRARGSSRWVAFIDLDEFLFSPLGPLPDVLRRYEAYPGVLVHWQCYGSSGYTDRPEGYVTDNFLRRAPTGWARNERVKSVVDPARAVRCDGPHYFEYVKRVLPVDERFRPATRVRQKFRKLKRLGLMLFPGLPWDPYARKMHRPCDVSVEGLRINHYAVRSLAEFEDKQQRWSRRSKIDPLYFRYHDRNDVYDDVLKGSVSQSERWVIAPRPLAGPPPL